MKLAEQMYKIANEINKPKISEWALKEIEKATKKGYYCTNFGIHELSSDDRDGLRLEGFKVVTCYNVWISEHEWVVSWNLKDSEVK